MRTTEDERPIGRVVGRVVAVRVGRAVERVWNGRRFVTGATKHVVAGPVHVGRLGLEGDEQGNRAVHGGPDKAVLLYSAEHYPRWRDDGFDVPDGGFFENLTVAGIDETDVRLGDTWRLGTATVQATQPRRPCRTLDDRWGRPRLAQEVQQTGRCGVYMRVLIEGEVEAGAEVVLLDRRPGAVTAAEANRIMNLDRDDVAGIRRMLAAPELPTSWREKLERRLTGHLEDDSDRLGNPPSG